MPKLKALYYFFSQYYVKVTNTQDVETNQSTF